jgi:hypothetical protein
MAARKVIAVKDWSCGMSDELGRVVLTINPTEGEGFDDNFPGGKNGRGIAIAETRPPLTSVTPRQEVIGTPFEGVNLGSSP